MRRQTEIAELKAQQKVAVRSGDEEVFDAIQARIDHFEKAQNVPAKDPVVAEWESRNPWIMNPKDPKTIEANAFYISAKENNPNMTERDALAYVDERLNRLYPQKNALRDIPSRSETGAQRVTGAAKGVVSWNDLTDSELRDWKNFGETMFTDKKTFLKAVSDARKK
jgi:hypothetical protein